MRSVQIKDRGRGVMNSWFEKYKSSGSTKKDWIVGRKILKGVRLHHMTAHSLVWVFGSPWKQEKVWLWYNISRSLFYIKFCFNEPADGRDLRLQSLPPHHHRSPFLSRFSWRYALPLPGNQSSHIIIGFKNKERKARHMFLFFIPLRWN